MSGGATVDVAGIDTSEFVCDSGVVVTLEELERAPTLLQVACM